MANGLYNKEIKFELIDVDSVVLDNPNVLEIREPNEFGEIRLNLNRETEDRGGVNFEFGDEESNLGFTRHNQAYKTIQSIISINGSDSNIKLIISIKIDRGFCKIYEGDLIGGSMDEIDSIVYFRVKRIDFGDLFRTRYDVQNDIEGDQDLSGNKIGGFSLIDLPMHAKVYEIEGIKNVKDSDELSEDSFFESNLDLGSLWGVVSFNENTKNLDGFNDYGNIFTQYEEGVNNGLQGLHVDQNPIVRNSLHLYKTEINESIRIRVNQTIRFVLDTEGINLSGQTGNFDEITALNIYIWRVNNGYFVDRTELYTSGELGTSFVDSTVTIEHDQELELNPGDEIYYGFQWFFGVGGFKTAQAFNFLSRSIQPLSGFAKINTNQRFPVSNAKGAFIYDVLNRLIQKAVSGKGVGEIRIHYTGLLGTFSVGQIVRGVDSKARGKIFALDGVLSLIEVSGGFVSGEMVETDTGSSIIDYMIYGKIGSGKILKSTLLEKEEGGDVDGCASLNFITNGFAIRDFINKEYENDRFYGEGEKVSFEGVDYIYINELVTSGNTPPNILFWKVEEGRKIRSSIKKIINFLKFRYGVGVGLIKEPGIGFGTSTKEKITRVIIEKNSHFFQDKKIVTLSNLVNPPIRRINKSIIFNEIEFGYSIYAEENENNSINGYNTLRNYLTPIEKEKNKLDLVADVGADALEIERLRRLKFSDSSNESDEKDEDTFIIKCQRHNVSNPIKGTDRIDNQVFAPASVNRDANQFFYKGLYIGNFIDHVSSFTHVGIGTFTIEEISFFEDQNGLFISTVEDIPGTGVQGLNDYEMYFNIDVFLPERLNGFSEVSNGGDVFSEYNIDHSPSNFLIQNFSWFGGGLDKKKDNESIRFTSGINNYFFEKRYDDIVCNSPLDLIKENESFEISRLREYDPAIFTDDEYEVVSYVSFDEFTIIRDSLVGESEEDTNFGYIEFVNNDNILVKAFPINIEYNPIDLRLEIICWEKKE